ncbi:MULTISPECIES: hypothetical protein [unclassified Methylobacterium]|uniref:hypothetical protein n=1 Tax=unclassified Methylobacterium TaxID=2615210 RepID=UPI000AC26537|nr:MULTISPECIES: hypothetical protein [unclassified Methylobacterium]
MTEPLINDPDFWTHLSSVFDLYCVDLKDPTDGTYLKHVPGGFLRPAQDET